MCQKNLQFINISNRFSITSHIFYDITFIDQIYSRTPPIDNTLPHFFYTNAKTIEHKKIIL